MTRPAANWAWPADFKDRVVFPMRSWRRALNLVLAVSLICVLLCAGAQLQYDYWTDLLAQSPTLSVEAFGQNLTRCTAEELAQFTATHFTPLRRFIAVLAAQSVLQGCFCLFARFFRRPRRSVLTVLFLLQAAVCAGSCAVLAGATEVFYLESPLSFYLVSLLCCAAAPLWLLLRLWKRPPRSSSPSLSLIHI